MVLPRVFRNERERVILSFNWTDLATGTGYRTFYPAAAQDSASIEYFLTQTRIDGNPIKDSLNGSSSEERNFDIEFEQPQTIRGTAFFNFTQFVGASSSTKTQIEVFHVDKDSNEISLGTKTSLTRNGTNTWRELLKIELTEKHFAIGEKLRISVIFTHTGANSSNNWFDPASSITTTDILGRTVGTDFVCNIPFKIDL